MGTTIAPAVQATALFIPELGPRKREAAIQCMVTRARAAGAIREGDSVRDALLLRERLGTTAVGKGVAIPNVRSLGVRESRLVFARSSRGIDWGAPDQLPVHLVLLVLSPAELALEAHVDMVGRVVAVTRLARHRARLTDAVDVDVVVALMRQVAP
jgi:mannitol/fructose-specific phosphotransferase system IIA component (Ntr-type)